MDRSTLPNDLDVDDSSLFLSFGAMAMLVWSACLKWSAKCVEVLLESHFQLPSRIVCFHICGSSMNETHLYTKETNFSSGFLPMEPTQNWTSFSGTLITRVQLPNMNQLYYQSYRSSFKSNFQSSKLGCKVQLSFREPIVFLKFLGKTWTLFA